MADCKFILGCALILLVAYDADAGATPAAPTPAAPATVPTPVIEKVTGQLQFNYIVNASSTNLTDGSEDYDKVKSEFEAALLQTLKKGKMGDGFVGVNVTGLRMLSEDMYPNTLDIDIEIVVDKKKSHNYEVEVKTEMKRLNDVGLTVGGEHLFACCFSNEALDMTLAVTVVELEVGIDKPFEVQCMYSRLNKTEVIAIKNIKLLHKAPGKAKFEDVASIYDNSVFENKPFNPRKPNVFKSLGAKVSGLWTKNSYGETFIKLQWTYPKENIVGDFKCVVQWSDIHSNSGSFEKSQTIIKKPADLKTVIQNVVRIDKSLDALKVEVNAIDSRGMMNRVIKSDSSFGESTYLIAKRLWGNTVSAQTLCLVNGAYLVEVDTADEWAAIQAALIYESGPVLAGATNKRDLASWEFMRGTGKTAFLDWSPSADLDSTDKRCMAFHWSTMPRVGGSTYKMINVKCSAMMYETFMCEMPAQPMKK